MIPGKLIMTNSYHVFRQINSDWIYKGEFNLDTQETTFGPLWADDKLSFNFPQEDSDCELMDCAASGLPDIFAPIPQ